MIRIEEVAEVFNGKTPSKNEQRVKGFPILKIRDIDEDGKFNGSFGSFVDEKFYKKYSKKRLKPGDTIILNAAHNANYVGNKNTIVGEDLDGIIATGEWLIVRPIEIDPFFLNSYLKSFKGKQKIKNEVKGIHLYPRDVQRIKIPFPSPDDQRRIATLLSKAESLIAKRKKSITDLDELLKSTFLEMFGDPVRNEKGWEEKKLGDLFKIKHGYAFKSKFFKESGDYVLLTPGNFYEKGGYRDRGDKQKYYVGEILEEYVLKKGEMLVAMTEQASGLLGSPIIVPESNSFLHNQRLGKIVPQTNGLQFSFLFEMFNSQGVRASIDFNAAGLKVRHTSPTKIEKIVIGYPPPKFQTQFAAIVEKAESIKEKYQDSLNDLEILYGALSQKAFKGELDLSRIPLVHELKANDITTGVPQPGKPSLTVQDDPKKEPLSREQTLHQLFQLYIADLNNDCFSLDDFWIKAEEKFMETMDEEDPPLGMKENDQVKKWLFELLASGKALQVFNEIENRMEIRMAS